MECGRHRSFARQEGEMTQRWQHALVFSGVFVFVLVWIVRHIDYDNLVKWRGIVRKREGNWTWWALGVFFVCVLVAAYSLYWVIIHQLN